VFKLNPNNQDNSMNSIFYKNKISKFLISF
jgi:hypothetical protein